MSAIIDLSRQHLPVSSAARLQALAQYAEQAGSEFDIYGTGTSLQAFEALMAETFGKPSARFFATGTACQQAVLRAHVAGAEAWGGRAKPKILVHPTSHLVYLDCLRSASEQIQGFGAACANNLADFSVVPFGEMARVPTFADIEAVVATHSPVSVLILELPQRESSCDAETMSLALTWWLQE